MADRASTVRLLKVGMMFPDTEREMGGSARWADLLVMAETAEACRFESICVADQLNFRFEKAPQEV